MTLTFLILPIMPVCLSLGRTVAKKRPSTTGSGMSWYCTCIFWINSFWDKRNTWFFSRSSIKVSWTAKRFLSSSNAWRRSVQWAKDSCNWICTSDMTFLMSSQRWYAWTFSSLILEFSCSRPAFRAKASIVRFIFSVNWFLKRTCWPLRPKISFSTCPIEDLASSMLCIKTLKSTCFCRSLAWRSDKFSVKRSKDSLISSILAWCVLQRARAAALSACRRRQVSSIFSRRSSLKEIWRVFITTSFSKWTSWALNSLMRSSISSNWRVSWSIRLFNSSSSFVNSSSLACKALTASAMPVLSSSNRVIWWRAKTNS